MTQDPPKSLQFARHKLNEGQEIFRRESISVLVQDFERYIQTHPDPQDETTTPPPANGKAWRQ